MNRTLLRIEDRHSKRDLLWVDGLAVARHAVETAGQRCMACGGLLWDNESTGRLYCDETCKARFYRRRERLKRFLRDRDECCTYCGSEV